MMLDFFDVTDFCRRGFDGNMKLVPIGYWPCKIDFGVRQSVHLFRPCNTFEMYKAALQHHPDKGGNGEQFVEIKRAADCLKDSRQRLEYLDRLQQFIVLYCMGPLF